MLRKGTISPLTAILLLMTVSLASARLDAEAVSPTDVTWKDDQDLMRTLLDPGDVEEAVLQVVIEQLPSCVGTPTFRTHTIYGLVLQVEETCLDAQMVAKVYEEVMKSIETSTPPELQSDELRGLILRAIVVVHDCYVFTHCPGGDRDILPDDESTPSSGASTNRDSNTSDEGLYLDTATREPVEECNPPSAGSYTRSTPITITIYFDATLYWPDYRDDQVSWFINYLNDKTNGEYVKHATKPDVVFCVAYAGEVPDEGPLDGDIGSERELQDLAEYEAGFTDASDVVVVFGAGEIKPTSGGSTHKGLTTGPDLSDVRTSGPASFYTQYYAYSSAWAGIRIGVHEMGHVFTLGHSTCDDGPHADWNDYLHTMALSADRDESCKPYPGDVYHHHFNFRPSDRDTFVAEHVSWCQSYNPSC